MRIDLVSIFPAYFDALALSLPGKARESGLIDLQVHDLRAFTHDRHRTVDDTPYGGGAGMVMKPEPWGEAFDDLGLTEQDTVVFTTPSGERFDQAKARDLASRPRLVFACGRYEGIDERVVDEARSRSRVELLSLGDYVLNGGEVAALAMVEAVVRLLPGFMGNPASLVEESHEDGLLEHPVYTKPASWRGRDVPPVLLSGDHGAVARWRREQALQRTVARRPDLAAPSVLAGVASDGVEIRTATAADAGELFTLTRACWLQEQWTNPATHIPALHESLQDAVEGLRTWTTLVAVAGGRIVGSARGRVDPDEPAVWDIGRLMVAPDLQGRGLGRRLLGLVEELAPAGVSSYRLLTGALSEANIRMYKKAGYRLRGPAPDADGAVLLTKPRRARA